MSWSPAPRAARTLASSEDAEFSDAFDQRRPMLRVEGELGRPRGAAVDLQSFPDRGLERAEKTELDDSRCYLGGAPMCMTLVIRPPPWSAAAATR